MIRWHAVITVVLIVSLLVSGCYTTRLVVPGEKFPRKTTTVDGVVLTSGDTVHFRDHDGLFEPATGHIMGYAVNGTYRLISEDDVSYLILREKEPISWTVAGLLVVGAIVVVVVAVIASSAFSDEHWIIVN